MGAQATAQGATTYPSHSAPPTDAASLGVPKEHTSMTKTQIRMAIEHVGGLYIVADEDSELETQANDLLVILWDAYDEAEDDE